MSTFSFKQTFVKGVMLALPLAIIFYVLFRVIGILQKVITPLAKKTGISNLFGEVTLTVITAVCLVIIVFVLGLLMRLAFIASFRKYIQNEILRLVPSLNRLELMASEKLDIENTVTQWKPVLVEKDEIFSPAYIIEETDDLISLALVRPPSTEPHKLLITKRSSVRYTEITMNQMKQFNKQFGKGYIAIAETIISS